MTRKNFEVAGIIGQWLASLVTGVGIGVELLTGADLGHIIITCGAVIFAFFTKIRYYTKRR